MKEKISLPTKYAISIIFVFVSIIFGAIIFFAKNEIRHYKELKTFTRENVNGTIIRLNSLSRGTYSIDIRQEGIDYESPSLPIAWEVKKYNIQVSDSISKGAKSKIITFYKLKNGSYEKYYDYEMP